MEPNEASCYCGTHVFSVGPELVKNCCLNGVIGSFPAPNARPIELLDQWMGQLNEELEQPEQQSQTVKLLHGR